jgi:signal transduction histidine kinase
LFISERSGGGFYTQEEIEIARAAVQRWMDSLAAAEIARRLVNLQQQKQTETRLLDQKSRRILHDDILPLLHTALLTDPHSPAAIQITEAHQQISRLLREAPPPPPAEIASSGLFTALERIARSEADLLQARLVMDIGDRAVQAAASLPSDTAETVFYAARECLRNIQKHTQPTGDGVLEIRIRSEVSGMLQIIIENNGISRGTDDDTLSSSGQGIQLHNAMLAVFGGGLRLEKLDSGNTRVTISVPIKP